MWPLSFYRDKSAAEKRRQLIQESKFLGGDMEHTHLVKGLDFALLQKVSLGWQMESNTSMLNALISAFWGEEGDCCQFRPCRRTNGAPSVGLIAIHPSSLSLSFIFLGKQTFPDHLGVVKSPHSSPSTTCTLAQLFCFTYNNYHTLLFNCLICLSLFL